jgi:intein/homing endonuclease
MADGTFKDVIDVQLGDKVKTSGGEGTIIKQYPYTADKVIYSMNGSDYFVTDSHPFMTTDGWKSFNPEATRIKVPSIETKLLQRGDILLREDGTQERLEAFTFKTEFVTVYNFSVDGTHDFYANGYWVHNK